MSNASTTTTTTLIKLNSRERGRIDNEPVDRLGPCFGLLWDTHHHRQLLACVCSGANCTTAMARDYLKGLANEAFYNTFKNAGWHLTLKRRRCKKAICPACQLREKTRRIMKKQRAEKRRKAMTTAAVLPSSAAPVAADELTLFVVRRTNVFEILLEWAEEDGESFGACVFTLMEQTEVTPAMLAAAFAARGLRPETEDGVMGLLESRLHGPTNNWTSERLETFLATCRSETGQELLEIVEQEMGDIPPKEAEKANTADTPPPPVEVAGTTAVDDEPAEATADTAAEHTTTDEPAIRKLVTIARSRSKGFSQFIRALVRQREIQSTAVLRTMEGVGGVTEANAKNLFYGHTASWDDTRMKGCIAGIGMPAQAILAQWEGAFTGLPNRVHPFPQGRAPSPVAAPSPQPPAPEEAPPAPSSKAATAAPAPQEKSASTPAADPPAPAEASAPAGSAELDLAQMSLDDLAALHRRIRAEHAQRLADKEEQLRAQLAELEALRRELGG